MTPQQQREKVLRDALARSADGDCGCGCSAHKTAVAALADAAAIPDADELLACMLCGSNEHWTCRGKPAPLRHFEGADCEQQAIAATRTVPSRAELIELMCATAQKAFNAGLGRYEYMARVLDALVKAGAVKL